MSSLVQIILDPWSMGLALFFDWWAIWFALGRTFSPTTVMTASANAIWFCLAGMVGHLFELKAEPEVLDWMLVVATATFLKASILRIWMLKFLPGWKWNRYDLAVLMVSTGCALLCAAWL